MKSKPTKTPWGIYNMGGKTMILGSHSNRPVVLCVSRHGHLETRNDEGLLEEMMTSDLDLNRMVDCVNACEGINPEAVADMFEWMKANLEAPTTECRADEDCDHCEGLRIIGKAKAVA